VEPRRRERLLQLGHSAPRPLGPDHPLLFPATNTNHNRVARGHGGDRLLHLGGVGRERGSDAALRRSGGRRVGGRGGGRVLRRGAPPLAGGVRTPRLPRLPAARHHEGGD
jgi:hypothetical protein